MRLFRKLRDLKAVVHIGELERGKSICKGPGKTYPRKV